MLSDLDLETAVKRTIVLYNRTRSPEVLAKLVFVCPVSVTVSFTGGFCYGCGVMDYVDGFAQQFKALTGKFELKVSKTREINPRTFEADYSVKAR